MAIPILPIILAVSALGSGLVQGITSIKNANAQAEATAEQFRAQANERARNAKKLMQQQKTSFLKSGIYFDSGTPLEVINETYDTMNKDIQDMRKDADNQINNLMRQGRTAFFGSLLEGALGAGMGYFMGGGNGLMKALSSSKIGSAIQNSTVGTNFSNWYNSARGWTKGGFGNTTNSTKIV